MADSPLVLLNEDVWLEDGIPIINDGIKNAHESKQMVLENKGLNTNSGSIYPLDNVIRGGQTHTVEEQIKNVVLYAEVIGAKKDKYYTIDFFANGILVDGVAKWGVSLSEHNKDTFSTKLEFGRRLIHYGTDDFTQPSTDIVTRSIRFDEDDLTFVFTYDKSKIVGTSLNIGDHVYGRGKGCIIHGNRYRYGFKNGYLRGNQGVNYPLKNVVRDGATHGEIEDIKNAILDVKVMNTVPGKVYKIEYIANGHTVWGDPNYSVYLYEYDPGFLNKRVVFDRYNQNTPAPKSTIETKVISNSKEKVKLSVTIDYSKLTKNAYPLNNVGSSGYGYIIDESCYLEEIKTQSNISVSNEQVVVLKNGRVISVKFKYDPTQNMIIDFDKLGINELTHFKRFYFESNQNMDANFPALTPVEQLSTDWISPYGIVAKNNTTSSFGGTVGGNHGTDGSGGFATARHVETKVYADDKEVKDGEVSVGNKVVVVATHMIAASNTIDVNTGAKRDSVKEIVTYTISPRHVQVSVLLEALENVEFTRYVGLQSTARYWGKHLYFMEDTTKTVFDIETGPAVNSGLFPVSKPNRFILKKSGNVLMAYTKHELGIKTNYIADNEPVLFSSDLKKVYSHLVKSKNLSLNKGSVAYYVGGYVFSPDLPKTVAESAYSYYENGDKIYVLDFFNAGEVFFMPDATDLNKEIEVIKKTDTITIDPYVTGKGIKITATGYGQVFFRME